MSSHSTVTQGTQGTQGTPLPQWNTSTPSIAAQNGPTANQIEDYQAGYPRFAALLSAYDRFFTIRRFSRLRARLLLLKQDKLTVLEERLDEIDRTESSLLFLGKSRIDGNQERLDVLSEIEAGLADYDHFVERTEKALSYSGTEKRDLQSLRNWVEGNGTLARDETEYLDHERDLCSLAQNHDGALFTFETWVEDRIVQTYRGFRQRKLHNVSTDQNVFIYSGSMIRRFAKALIITLITLLLLVPIVVCNVIKVMAIRIVCVMIFTIIYLLILSSLTRAKTTELIIAGTTYATVLIVFVSGQK